MKDYPEKINGDCNAILQGLKLGTERAFDCLFDLHYNTVYNFVRHFVKEENVIDDIVSETFVRFWEKRLQTEFKGMSSVKSYLFKIAHNLCLDFFRQMARDRILYSEVTALADQEPHDYYEQYGFENRNKAINEICLVVRKMISELPDRCGRILTLYYLEQLPIKEIAAKLGVKEESVRSQKRYGISLLQDHLQKGCRLRKLYYKD
jgi:RNA polymerase sigma-70 factor (ECF subfamily)